MYYGFLRPVGLRGGIEKPSDNATSRVEVVRPELSKIGFYGMS